ncbi:hypothetical protein AGMMS49574_10410 [Bacteroidia bacterium]|nr:hypothetical protein AGMMS49574_10410 [Bacteroidia bacterium]
MKTKKRLIGILFAAAIALLPAFLPGAQAANVDSLEQVLRTGKLSNDERLQLYLDLYAAYRKSSNKRKSIYYLQRAATQARLNIKDSQGQLRFLRLQGSVFFLENKLDSAMSYYKPAIRLAQELGDKKREMEITERSGIVYYGKGMYFQALQCFLEALAYFEQAGDKEGLAGAYFHVGTAYRHILNDEKSLYYLSKAEALSREIGDKDNIALTMLEIAIVQSDTRSRDKAAMDSLIASVRQAIGICQETGNRSHQELAYRLLYGFYTSMDDFANAQACLDSAYQLNPEAYADKLKDNYYVYYSQGKYAECEEAALASMASRDDILDFDISALYSAMEHVILANIKMGNAERAEKYLDELWVEIKKYMSAEYEKGFSEMQVKYETEKKELRIAVLEKEREFYLWLGLAAAVILLLVLLAMFLWIKWVKKERQLVATQSVLDGEIAERTRLARDLHDGLGGMLSVVKLNLEEIKNGVPAKDVERYDYVLNPLNDSINELHRVTHNMMPDSLARSGLKMSLTDFCHSIPGVDFQYLGAADRLDPKLEVMIYRTVHELVNNALRHADAMHILVQIIRENSRLSLVVQDDGRGFDPKAITSGMGLKNIRHRVAANNGHLEISSEKGKGTEISMEFKI